MTHEKECLKVREWNRRILLAMLDADNNEALPEGTAGQLVAQLQIQEAMKYIAEAFVVGYEDEDPARHGPDRRLRKELQRTYLLRYTQSCEENLDFMTARKILICAIRQYDVEQKYDLHRLMDFNLPAIHDDGFFEVNETDYMRKLKNMAQRGICRNKIERRH